MLLKRIIILILLYSSLLILSCTDNREMLILKEFSSKELYFNWDSYNFYIPTIYYEKDGKIYDVYVYNTDSTIKFRDMSDSLGNAKYSIPIADYSQLSSINVNNDTIAMIYLENNIIKLQDLNGWSETVEIPIDTNSYSVSLSISSKAILDNNQIYFNYTSKKPPLYIDTFHSMVYDRATSSIVSKIGRYPERYYNRSSYIKNIQQINNSNNIYFIIRKSDSVYYYESPIKDRNEELTIRIFTDFKRPESTPYDTSKRRQVEYLSAYNRTTELNIQLHQKQDKDQLYIIKRLEKEKIADKSKFVLGKIRNKKYVGFGYLPEDFNEAGHFIKNDTIFYLSLLNDKTTWKGFSISEK